VRGKYATRFPEGGSVIVLEPDLANVLPDWELVNQALRALAENITASQHQRHLGIVP
jgi:hypothetical protein